MLDDAFADGVAAQHEELQFGRAGLLHTVGSQAQCVTRAEGGEPALPDGVGFGPSQSTVGSNRTGRQAVNSLLRQWHTMASGTPRDTGSAARRCR